MSRASLLVEIGCEEIPARMIPAAARDLGQRVASILDQAGLARGDVRWWGGARRLAVQVDGVSPRQSDREELVLGPAARVALDAEGRPTAAGLGFARKQGIDPELLRSHETDKGTYVGFHRRVVGRDVGEVLAEALPGQVQSMAFPKSMRWGDGRCRWVRPVHWVLALHGDRPLDLELFGVRSGAASRGHRFLGAGVVPVARVEAYASALETAHVLIDPARRRTLLSENLERAADLLGGTLVADRGLLEEVADLVEWPGVVVGRFDPSYLELPRELLVTTLRHHQKCFSVQDRNGTLLSAFLAVANTDRDRAGHIRRGNEWVVNGRLEDARFFWREDSKHALEEHSARLAGVVFHGRESYADKARRLAELAGMLAERIGLGAEAVGWARRAAALCKNDLVSGTVGEFPELQGKVGGLLLRAEGAPAEVASAVYEHYAPLGPDDAIPGGDVGCVVAVTDKLDSVARLIAAGQVPTGSRDPFALRRASNGIFRILVDRRWAISIQDLCELGELGEPAPGLREFLVDRLQNHLRERGFSSHEVQAVFQPRLDERAALSRPLHDAIARLEAIRSVGRGETFARLVDLTKRVDNILTKNAALFESAASAAERYTEEQPAALELWEMTRREGTAIERCEVERRYADALEVMARFVEPVDRFFAEVLVIDPGAPAAMLSRRDLLSRLHGVLTRCFDIRELAGQAERRSP